MRFHTFSIFVGLFIAGLLLAGCTVNPQDLAPKGPRLSGNGSGTNYTGGNGTGGLVLTMAEVAKHNTSSDCWIVIRNQVLDLTSYASHPGGANYVPFCGTDGTAAYGSIKGGQGHDAYADSLFSNFLVGTLGSTVSANATAPAGLNGSVAPPRRDNGFEDD